MGLLPPTSGQVPLDGEDIAGWQPHLVARAGVAYVPERRLIFPDLTVIQNIRVAERRPANASIKSWIWRPSSPPGREKGSGFGA